MVTDLASLCIQTHIIWHKMKNKWFKWKVDGLLNANSMYCMHVCMMVWSSLIRTNILIPEWRHSKCIVGIEQRGPVHGPHSHHVGSAMVDLFIVEPNEIHAKWISPPPPLPPPLWPQLQLTLKEDMGLAHKSCPRPQKTGPDLKVFPHAKVGHLDISGKVFALILHYQLPRLKMVGSHDLSFVFYSNVKLNLWSVFWTRFGPMLIFCPCVHCLLFIQIWCYTHSCVIYYIHNLKSVINSKVA